MGAITLFFSNFLIFTTVIDPMRNIYLGSAKHMIKLWINTEPAIITKIELKTMQALVNTMHVPADVGI